MLVCPTMISETPAVLGWVSQCRKKERKISVQYEHVMIPLPHELGAPARSRYFLSVNMLVRPMLSFSRVLFHHRLGFVLVEKNSSSQLLGGLAVANGTKVKYLQ